MGLFRHAVYTGTIWLTAVMTLIAGAPHFDCRCANGHVKPYCLGLAAKKGCCCAGSCCSSPPRAEEENATSPDPSSAPAGEKSCCCHEQRQSDAGRNPAESTFEKTGCQKTFVEAADAVPSAAKVVVPDLLTPLFLLFPASVFPPFEIRLYADSFASNQGLSPPTDLVIVLQRFLI